MAVEHDLVLIHYEDQPLSYARIESIAADHKRDWYHVKLLMLQIPLQVVTWILRDVYINGEEFTMGGKRIRLEPVVSPPDPELGQPRPENDSVFQTKSAPLKDAQLERAKDVKSGSPASSSKAKSSQTPGKVIAFPPKSDG